MDGLSWSTKFTTSNPCVRIFLTWIWKFSLASTMAPSFHVLIEMVRSFPNMDVEIIWCKRLRRGLRGSLSRITIATDFVCYFYKNKSVSSWFGSWNLSSHKDDGEDRWIDLSCIPRVTDHNITLNVLHDILVYHNPYAPRMRSLITGVIFALIENICRKWKKRSKSFDNSSLGVRTLFKLGPLLLSS